MNVKMIFHTLGKILLLEAILMLLPCIVCLVYKEYNHLLSFIIPMLILLGLGIISQIKKPEKNRIFAKEGFLIVGLSWIALSIFGALPFVISGMIPNYIEALFETVSGFSTTGSSIIPNVDVFYSGFKGVLFWRSLTHWIGGMGVLVFVLAILPNSEGQNIYLIKAESTGANVGKLVSKVKVTARILYVIYFVLTLILFLLLCFDPKMSVYDSFIHAFGTAGTGGFGVRSQGIAYYSVYSQIVIAVFMMLFGINFNMFYLLLIGKFRQVIKSEELRWYLGIITIATIVVGIDIFLDASLMYSSIGEALKDSYFQISSIITTTGFATADFAKWSNLSRTILFLLMFVGGCAGSTGGGLKVQRVIILIKSSFRELNKIIHPRQVKNIKFEGNKLDDDVVKGVTNYFAIIMIIFVIALFILSFDKSAAFNLEDNIVAVATCINNIGPGLSNIIGPMASFKPYNDFSKITLTLLMLIGRLEIYPILLIFNVKMWVNK